ncbi:MAG: nicotinate (nicotinamide) nucleotide adenylyltransferase [Anaerolineae bacterium]|nr:nicotinate (nicotinamide) nucleotide adenylyltransferase [Anaerolineae bacterium]
MQRIGILGGTFDPPHIGHLVLAQYALDALDLASVLFVPAADPPHKDQLRYGIDHRLPMLELAVAGNGGFVISRVDIDRPGPHYTVDMVRILQEQQPDVEFYFLMGGDSLHHLPQWYHPLELIALCKLAVMARPGGEITAELTARLLPGLAERVVVIDSPMLGFSSTEIAERLLAGKSVRYLVPDSVLSYIQDHGLYQHGA